MRIITAKEFGSLIRTTRKRQQLTQAELAGVCGVGVRFIVDLESGKATCQLEKTLLVLQMLGIQLNAQSEGGEDS